MTIVNKYRGIAPKPPPDFVFRKPDQSGLCATMPGRVEDRCRAAELGIGSRVPTGLPPNRSGRMPVRLNAGTH